MSGPTSPPGWLTTRLGQAPVALETTLLAHGVPSASALALHERLSKVVREEGAAPALVGLVEGRATVGMTDDELRALLAAETVPKVNTSNLGAHMRRRSHGATTVSATMELSAAAGVRVFATGGLGGVHRRYAERLDVSSDLTALARFPVAVVASGVKSMLDVGSTREALETLGVPVVGWRTDSFPAFYLRDSGSGVDARFDDEADLAAFLDFELDRTERGVLVAQPIPEQAALAAKDLERWLGESEAKARAAGASGRSVTPRTLEALHEASGGATLRANLALVEANARLSARLATRLGEGGASREAERGA